MATAEAETSSDERVQPGGVVYDGFISYSHAADDLLAPRLQAGLQRFAKPWWKRRALRIFRDESSLSANPHLWSSITDALDRSAWFVLLLSPDAAESPWVNNEVEYWLEHKDPDRIIPVLTDGDFGWAEEDVTGDAVPPALQGAFADEPRWVDLGFARTDEQLDLKNPQFSAAIADVASAIRGVPKEELASEEVRQHRRTVRTAWAAAVALLILAVLAGSAALFAFGQRNEAQKQTEAAQTERDRAVAAEDAAKESAAAESVARQDAERNAELARSRELSASAINVLDQDAELSVLLALAAAETDEPPIEATSALHEALSQHRVLHTYRYPEDRVAFVMLADLHPSGRYLVVAGNGDYLEVWDTEEEETVWSKEWGGEGSIFPSLPAFSRDGERVTTGVAYWPFSADTEGAPPAEELGVFVWDAFTGEVITRFDTGPCGAAMYSWPSATHAIVQTPVGEVCAFENEIEWQLLDLATGELTFLATGRPSDGAAISADGSVIAFDDVDLVTHVIDLASGQEILRITPEDRLDAQFYVRALNADGSMLILGDRPLQVWDVAAGEMVTRFDGHDGEAWGFVSFSDDGRLAYSAGRDGTVRIWDPISGEEIDVLPGAENAIAAVMSSDGSTMLVGDAGALVVRLWDLSPVTGEIAAVETCSGFAFASSLQIGDARGVVSIRCGDDYHGTAQVISLDPIELERLMPVHGGQMTAFAPDGVRLAQLDGAEGSTQGPVRIHDVHTGATGVTIESVCVYDNEVPVSAQPQCVAPPATPFLLWPAHMAFSPSGSHLAAVQHFQFGGHLAVWDASTGEVVHVHNAPRDPLLGSAISAEFMDDSRLWVNFSNRAFQILDTGSWEVVEQIDFGGEQPFPESAIFARNNTYLVGTSVDELIWYDTSSWELVRIKAGLHRGTIKDHDINPSETLIATGGSDGFVRVWDFDTGGLVYQIPIAGGQAQNVGFVDDDHLMVVPQDGNILVFTINTAELLEIARDRVTRGFSATECETYRIAPCLTVQEIRNG